MFVGPLAEKFNLVGKDHNARTSAIFSFSIGNSLFGQICSKTQTCQFKLKFCNKTKSNMQNSMGMLTFSTFDWKYFF